MITWQDPVALSLAALLVGGALWFRRWLIKRGEGGHCAQCTLGTAAGGDTATVGDEAPKAAAKPTIIDVSQLRIGSSRARPPSPSTRR